MWALTGSQDLAAGVEGDVVTACSLVRRTTWASDDPYDLVENTTRWKSAYSFVANARSHPGQDGSRYDGLSNALEASLRLIQDKVDNRQESSPIKLRSPEFDEAERKVRDACAAF